MPDPGTASSRPAQLRPDCRQCFGLCCVGLAFSASADFAFDKRPDVPCRNLAADDSCTIHARLRDSGMRGCTTFDCLGAGQRVSQVTFGARSWRTAPGTAHDMFAALPVMRELHTLLAYLADALSRPQAESMRGELSARREEINGLCELPAEDLMHVALTGVQERTAPLLEQVSRVVRLADRPGAVSLRGADLLGAKRRGADLRAADLRGACLIAADLRGADLREADMIGADLRDTDLCGADLSNALFVVQPQVNAARGDAATVLPPFVDRPSHWV